MSGPVIEINEEKFHQYIKNNGYTLVDFWAPWCGPCRSLGPVVEKIAEKYRQNKGNVIFTKLNVDENQKIAAEVGVRGIPMLVLYKDGEAVTTHVGSMNETELEKWLEKFAI